MYTTDSNTQYKNESKHSEMGTVRQNPILYVQHGCENAQITTEKVFVPPYGSVRGI